MSPFCLTSDWKQSSGLWVSKVVLWNLSGSNWPGPGLKTLGKVGGGLEGEPPNASREKPYPSGPKVEGVTSCASQNIWEGVRLRGGRTGSDVYRVRTAWPVCEISEWAPGWASSFPLGSFRPSEGVVRSVWNWCGQSCWGQGRRPDWLEGIFWKFWCCIVLSDEFPLGCPGCTPAILLPQPPKFWHYSHTIQQGFKTVARTPFEKCQAPYVGHLHKDPYLMSQRVRPGYWNLWIIWIVRIVVVVVGGHSNPCLEHCRPYPPFEQNFS